jgi:hypothetical protein
VGAKGFVNLLAIEFSYMSNLSSPSESSLNRLGGAHSLYLRQHAHNPVHWQPWGEAAWEEARSKQRLVLVSVGYAACHWCHVMEREVFEDAEVAEVMNRHLVCIKVDREEHPDVDHLYMEALQLMSGHGGWPLNCFCLPDGRPVYAGTYFPRSKWMEVLEALSQTWAQDPQRVLEYGTRIMDRLVQPDLPPEAYTRDADPLELLHRMVENWKPQWDRVMGGPNRAPKFPLPSNYRFLLAYARTFQDEGVMQYTLHSLEKMALGGIYDQVGGGFARYSVDGMWKVPHFEKMLYDNAQLLILYAEAYACTGNPQWARVVRETMAFCFRELRSPNGLFFSALDADSEGEEGRFYVFTEAEFDAALEGEHPWARAAFGMGGEAHWEHGHHVLLRVRNDADQAAALGFTPEQWEEALSDVRRRLMVYRSQRVRPAIDDKCLCAWNALMGLALLECGLRLGEEEWVQESFVLAERMEQTFGRSDGHLLRVAHAEGTGIAACLDDCAWWVNLQLALFAHSGDERWWHGAKDGLQRIDALFRKAGTPFFYTSSVISKNLVMRPMELTDQVIPSANAAMAHALYTASLVDGDGEKLERVQAMLSAVSPALVAYGSGHTHWALLALQHHEAATHGVYSGAGAGDFLHRLGRCFFPLHQAFCAPQASDLPLFLGRCQRVSPFRAYLCTSTYCLSEQTDGEAIIQQLHEPYTTRS